MALEPLHKIVFEFDYAPSGQGDPGNVDLLAELDVELAALIVTIKTDEGNETATIEVANEMWATADGRDWQWYPKFIGENVNPDALRTSTDAGAATYKSLLATRLQNILESGTGNSALKNVSNVVRVK